MQNLHGVLQIDVSVPKPQVVTPLIQHSFLSPLVTSGKPKRTLLSGDEGSQVE